LTRGFSQGLEYVDDRFGLRVFNSLGVAREPRQKTLLKLAAALAAWLLLTRQQSTQSMSIQSRPVSGSVYSISLSCSATR
jgi:hypothetical protein